MLRNKDILKKLKSFFEGAAAHYGIGMAFLYGSWARGNPHDDSDMDVAILFDSDALNKKKIFNRITDFSTNLSHLLDKEVNILVITRDFESPMIQYNAIVLGIPIFIKEFDRYKSLRMEAIFQMEDFSIFGRGWQLEIGERRLKGVFHVHPSMLPCDDMKCAAPL